VCPSARPHGQLGSRWMDFYEIWYLRRFLNIYRKFKFYLNLTRMAGTVHEEFLYFLTDAGGHTRCFGEFVSFVNVATDKVVLFFMDINIITGTRVP
jgi:hypothetical protein